MLEVAPQWIPVLTTEAGLSLTALNWQEVHIHTAVYYLDALLVKPGVSLLKTLPDFGAYANWSGTIVINASRLKTNKEGIITLISPYDGSKIRMNYGQLIEIIHHLKPQAVILPADILKECPDIWDNWPKEIMPYLSSNDLVVEHLPSAYGVYFTLSDCSSQIKEQLQHYKQFPRYVQGALSFAQINELRLMGINSVESDEPTSLGLNGLVYDQKQLIDLKDTQYFETFEPLSAECQCPTCTSRLTKAYLHHLFLHTPLLCQRFLIQHNAWQVQDTLRT